MWRCSLLVLCFLCLVKGVEAEVPQAVVFRTGKHKEIASLKREGKTLVFVDLDGVTHFSPAMLIDSEATAAVNRALEQLADCCSKGQAYTAAPIAGKGRTVFEELAALHFHSCLYSYAVETPVPRTRSPRPSATATPKPRPDRIYFCNGKVIRANVVEIDSEKIKAQYPGNSFVEVFPRAGVAKVAFGSGLVRMFSGCEPTPVAVYHSQNPARGVRGSVCRGERPLVVRYQGWKTGRFPHRRTYRRSGRPSEKSERL